MLQYYEPEKDYGTAPVVSEESVTVSIDGVSISARRHIGNARGGAGRHILSD